MTDYEVSMSQTATVEKDKADKEQQSTTPNAAPNAASKDASTTKAARIVLPARPREEADVVKGAENAPGIRSAGAGSALGLLAVSEIDAKVEKAYGAAGMTSPNSAKMEKGGLSGAPKTQAEAANAIQDSLDNAILYYSTPSRLQELGDTLRYLLPRYGVEAGRLDDKTVTEGNRKFQSTLGDPNEHAVFTDLMVRVYDGAVTRMEKAGRKSRMGDVLKIGEDGQKITKIGKIPALEKAYLDAVRRDHSTVWELTEDKDGKTVLKNRKAAGVFDWMGHTSQGMKESKDSDEAIGFVVGSTLRAIARLSPALLLKGLRREIEKKGDVRHETAKILTQIESLCKREVGISRPQKAEAGKSEANAISRGEGSLATPDSHQNTSYTYSQAAGMGSGGGGGVGVIPKETNTPRRGSESGRSSDGDERSKNTPKDHAETPEEGAGKVGKLPKSGGGTKRGKKSKRDREI